MPRQKITWHCHISNNLKGSKKRGKFVGKCRKFCKVLQLSAVDSVNPVKNVIES